MLRILLVDDEPLVLIGLQGMLEWEKLGYTVCGTARNGKLALELIEREKPDIVIADVKMPVMDGLTLARTCRERSALPAFIMLTSFEEFDYIKQAMGAGVVDYLVKLDLTPENLQTALAKAAEKVKKERALLGELSAQENLAESVRSYQERFFVRLYAGLFPDEAALEQPLQHMELNLASDAYLVASCEIIANTALTPAQQLKLSFSCGRMLETTLQNYLPCYVTGADAMRCNVLFCLTDAQCQNYRTVLRPLLERASQILYNYFTVRLLWAGGRPPRPLHKAGYGCSGRWVVPPAPCWGWRAAAGKTPICSPCSRWSSPSSSWRSTRAMPPPGRCRWWHRCRSILRITFRKN